MLNVKQDSCEYQLFKSLGLTRRGIQTKSTDYEADALTTRFDFFSLKFSIFGQKLRFYFFF